MRYRQLSKTAGPGILFACTAIGVSHLIQSTRAGADYGMLMIGFVVLASVLKYPFFEFGSRYANSTLTSIIDGYKRLGRPALWLYFLITISSMFFVTGAVGFVTAGFFENLFGIGFLGESTVLVLFAVCVAILAVGRYSILDKLIKVIAMVLLVSTVSAFSLAIYNGPGEQEPEFIPKEIWSMSGVFFLLALMGWMPAPLDLSSWSSLWTLERLRQTRYVPKLRETLLEFRLAYVITGILAVMFVVLGSLIFYGSGQELPNNNSSFAHQIVTLYTVTIGQWSYLLIASSAFSVMFGTVIALFDGYSRSVQRTVELLRPGLRMASGRFYLLFLAVLSAGSLIVIFAFAGNLRELVDFATVLSFVVAPVIAIFNLRLVTGRYIKPEDRPSPLLWAISIAGIAFLIGFAALFVLTRFVPGVLDIA